MVVQEKKESNVILKLQVEGKQVGEQWYFHQH